MPAAKGDYYVLKVLDGTDKAVKVQKGIGSPFWLPYSQIEPDQDYIERCAGSDCEIFIPDWLAEEKGLV